MTDRPSDDLRQGDPGADRDLAIPSSFDRARFHWHRNGWWFLRRKPVFEFDTRIYVGRPGAGKTLFATRDAILLMRQGVRVVSNYSIRDPLSGLQSIPIEDWLDMLIWACQSVIDRIPTVFVIDEINLWAPSRFYEKTPGWWLTLMAQRRHFGIGIIATAQSFSRIEKVLRELVNSIVFLKAFPIPVPLLDPKTLRPAIRRLPIFFAYATDPHDLEGAMATQGDAQGAAVRQKMPWGRPTWVKGDVFLAYSTEELMAVEEWREDEEQRRMVKALLDGATKRLKTVYIPSVVDAWQEITQALEHCWECEAVVECEGRHEVPGGYRCDRHNQLGLIGALETARERHDQAEAVDEVAELRELAVTAIETDDG